MSLILVLAFLMTCTFITSIASNDTGAAVNVCSAKRPPSDPTDRGISISFINTDGTEIDFQFSADSTIRRVIVTTALFFNVPKGIISVSLTNDLSHRLLGADEVINEVIQTPRDAFDANVIMDIVTLFEIFRSPRDRMIALGFHHYGEFDNHKDYRFADEKIKYLLQGGHVKFDDNCTVITGLSWEFPAENGPLRGQINWRAVSELKSLRTMDFYGNQLTGFVDLELVFLYPNALEMMFLASNNFTEIYCSGDFPKQLEWVSVLDNPLESKPWYIPYNLFLE